MMRFLRTVQLGLRSLRLHLLRSILTILGITCGVASVVAMLSVGEGASHDAQEQIKALGSTNIILKSIKPIDSATAGEQQDRTVKYGLLYDDASLIQNTMPNVKVMVSARDYPQELQFENRIANATVRGTVPWFPKVTNMKILQGSFIADIHERDATNVCVVTPDIARRMFLHEWPIGKVLNVGYNPFTVIGVIETHSGVKRTGQETDTNVNTIYVPMSTLNTVFGEEIVTRTASSMKRETVQLHEIQVQVDDTRYVEAVAASLRTLLKKTHDKADYDVVVPLELLRQAEETKRMFNIVLGAIAGISLVVGGIGIMNIMLASVTERTREIGIRRALGAQKRHIVLQFLVETVVLSCVGGAVGILLGMITPWVVTFYSKLTTIVRPEFLILSFGISAGVGIVFGIYPAQRAAAMDPIEALRHE